MFEDVHEFVATERAKRRRRCKFGTWLTTLDPAHVDQAEKMLADRAFSARELAAFFGSKGLAVDHQVLQRHRSGKCCRGTEQQS